MGVVHLGHIWNISRRSAHPGEHRLCQPLAAPAKGLILLFAGKTKPPSGRCCYLISLCCAARWKAAFHNTALGVIAHKAMTSASAMEMLPCLFLPCLPSLIKSQSCMFLQGMGISIDQSAFNLSFITKVFVKQCMRSGFSKCFTLLLQWN